MNNMRKMTPEEAFKRQALLLIRNSIYGATSQIRIKEEFMYKENINKKEKKNIKL